MNYVCGFLFHCESKDSVYLIRKDTPMWQRGLLNGIGGKIEEGETPHDAMVREFKEETGCAIGWWKPAVTLVEVMDGNVVHFYRACFASYFRDRPKTMDTTEPVELVEVRSLYSRMTIPNLKWLIPICQDWSLSPITVLDQSRRRKT